MIPLASAMLSCWTLKRLSQQVLFCRILVPEQSRRIHVRGSPPEGGMSGSMSLLSTFPFQESSSSPGLFSQFFWLPVCPVPSLFCVSFVSVFCFVFSMSCRILSFFGQHEASKFAPAVIAFFIHCFLPPCPAYLQIFTLFLPQW